MRTERAPTTALRGGSISEDSLVISTAVLAAPYTVLQRDSFDDPGSSDTTSTGSRDEEAMVDGTIFDEVARVRPGSLAP